MKPETFNLQLAPTSLPPPIVPVQTPEIDGLAQMAEPDSEAAVQIGDGAGDLQNSVVSAGGETQSVHCILEHLLPSLVDDAELAHHAARHLRVAEDVVMVRKTGLLNLARRHYPLSDVGAPLHRPVARQLGVRDGDDLYMEVGTSWDYRGRFI